MAGRPKKMAERTAGFEEQAICLSAGVFLAVPRQYLDEPDPGDPLGKAWRECVEMTMRASIACERLGDSLRAKAGIEGPGPTAQLMSEPPEGTTSDPSESLAD